MFAPPSHASALLLVSQALKLLIPIFEAENDFKQLAEIHSRMHESYKHIVEAIEKGKTYFTTYYRLAFFGDPKLLPIEIRDKHFIYRSKGLITLGEITSRTKVRVHGAEVVYSLVADFLSTAVASDMRFQLSVTCSCYDPVLTL